MKLDGRVALVTGASRGLGFEIAKLLAQRGVKLIIAARAEDELREAAHVLGRETEVLAVAVDISESAEQVVGDGFARFGHIDILINNASELGPSPMPTLAHLPWQAMEHILHVNVTAPLHLIQLVLPQMKERGEGVIVNITSDAGVNAYPSWGGYGASKAALEHLSRTLAAELEGTGIQVLVVDPGDMNTRMHRDAEPGVDLSHLPGPDVPAPAFIELIENASQPFGRFEAQRLVTMRT